jgi:hypothetical protein
MPDINPQLILVLGLLGACVALFIVNKPRMDVVALLAMVALPLAGIITLPEALAGFSDPNVVLIAALLHRRRRVGAHGTGEPDRRFPAAARGGK